MKISIKISCAIIFFMSVVSCKMMSEISISEKNFKGLAVGDFVVETGTFEKDLEVKGQIQKNYRLALRVSSKTFTKKEFKTFKKHKNSELTKVEFVDSLPNKPSYYHIELVDDLAFLDLIQADKKGSLYTWILNEQAARVVTGVSMVFEEGVLDDSATFYLVKQDNLSPYIEMVSFNGQKQKINFSEELIFDYSLSFFCWGKDSYGRLEIVDLVEKGNSCSSSLEKNPDKLIKEKSLFNY